MAKGAPSSLEDEELLEDELLDEELLSSEELEEELLSSEDELLLEELLLELVPPPLELLPQPASTPANRAMAR